MRLCVLTLLATLSCMVHCTHGIRFYLNPGERRCFSDELPTNSKITGETRVADGRSDMEIDVWITTSRGHVLYHKRASDHGKFSFSTPSLSKTHDDDVLDEEYDYEDPYEEDTFKICIEHQQQASRAHPGGTRRLVYFVLHQAFNGLRDNGEGSAKVEDTDRLQVKMREMHATLSGIVGDLNQLQRRERNLMKRVKGMGSTVTGLAVFGVTVTLMTSAAQYRYYHGYFKAKKLC